MTNKKITANDLLNRLNTDSKYIALKEEQDKKLSNRYELIRVDEMQLVNELREVGYNVNSVWDLVNTKTRYERAIPILLNHLQLPHIDRIVDGIARALAVPEPAVREVWPMLVNKYKNAAGRDEKCEVLNAIKGAKDGFACALAASASDTEMKDLVDLVRDQSNGITRVLMLSALRRSKKSEAILALKELANDPDLKNEIASWRKI